VTTAVAALLVAAPRDAQCADVGVVASRSDDPFIDRLVEELRQLGLEVVREARLAASARERLLVTVSDTGLELHDVDEGGILRRRAMVSSRADALGAAEEIRAVLLPLVERPPVASTAPRPSTAEASAPARAAVAAAPPPMDRPATLAAPPSSPAVELGAGASLLLGGPSPGGALTLSLGFFPRALRVRPFSFGVGVAGLAQLLAGSGVSGAQGTADVRALFFGPELIARMHLSRALAVGLGAGALATLVLVEGQANAPFSSRDDSAWTVSPGAHLRLAWRSGPLGLFAEARAGIALPAVAIRFDGAVVDEWGAPWGSLGGGASAAF